MGLVGANLALFGAFQNTNQSKPPPPDFGPVHVHALGVNPSDGALFIAAHTGLFRLGPSAPRLARVGDRRQDMMGFTVVGRDRFLGSGHPDLREMLPSLLGLIESENSGESWQPVSLLGDADFHVLRARGDHYVGYDSSRGRVMVSADRGKSWRAHHFDGPLFDLVIGPGRALLLLATTPSQLIVSRNGGRSWGGISETTGLLAWPQRDRLYLLASDGRLWLSPDRGRRWKELGEIGGHPTAFSVARQRMYAALHDGTIKTSIDDGRSWRLIARPTA